MFRYSFIICFVFLINLFGDYKNITISELVTKAALLNNINIIIPGDLNSSKRYTLTINNYITAKDLLKASKAILKTQGYKLIKLNKSFYMIEKIKDTRYKYIYCVKNSNTNLLLKKISYLYPNQLFKLNNRFILIKYSKKTNLQEIINNLKKIDTSKPAYYVELNIYTTDTNALKNIGINMQNSKINKETGTILLNKTNYNFFPTLLTLLEDKSKSKLIASPKLFLAPDTNNTAIFKEVTTVPITIKKTQIIPGTNPVVTNADNTIYKDIGLIMQLKFINTTQDNRVKLLLNLTDSNIISYSENGITSSARTIQAIIQAKLDSPIFIAGLSKTTTKHRIVGVPILKDIPIIKYLFSKKEISQKNRTLVITLEIRKATQWQNKNAVYLPGKN